MPSDQVAYATITLHVVLAFPVPFHACAAAWHPMACQVVPGFIRVLPVVWHPPQTTSISCSCHQSFTQWAAKRIWRLYKTHIVHWIEFCLPPVAAFVVFVPKIVTLWSVVPPAFTKETLESVLGIRQQLGNVNSTISQIFSQILYFLGLLLNHLGVHLGLCQERWLYKWQNQASVATISANSLKCWGDPLPVKPLLSKSPGIPGCRQGRACLSTKETPWSKLGAWPPFPASATLATGSLYGHTVASTKAGVRKHRTWNGRWKVTSRIFFGQSWRKLRMNSCSFTKLGVLVVATG